MGGWIAGFIAWLTVSVVTLISALGWLWVAAVALEFAAIVIEGGSKEPKKHGEEEVGENPGIASFIVMACASLATVFLFVHILLNTQLAYDRQLQFGAAGFVMFLVLTGSLYGALLARVAPNVARFCRVAKLPVSVAAFALALYATFPSVVFFMGMIGRFLS